MMKTLEENQGNFGMKELQWHMLHHCWWAGVIVFLQYALGVGAHPPTPPFMA